MQQPKRSAEPETLTRLERRRGDSCASGIGPPGPRFVDAYELSMADAYLSSGMASCVASFSLFFRGYPANRSYFLVAGIERALAYLEGLAFGDAELARLRASEALSDELLEYLRGLAFTGDVHAVSEGSLVFASEPVLEVTAPIIEAQLVETALMNVVTSATVLATKASRIVQAAAGRPVIDMGARRSSGTDAALLAARSGYLAGFAATSLVEATELGVPTAGTMAHSFVQAAPDELTAFRRFVERNPDDTTLLVDTHDVAQGVRNAITIAQELGRGGHSLGAIRLDSGDVAEQARISRSMLDAAGLERVRIVATGGLDEYAISELVAGGAPIDAFGVGTKYCTSADAPYVESAYKMVEIDGVPVRKLSPGKRTLPWRKQVFRVRDAAGMMVGDTITRRDGPAPVNEARSVAPMLRSAMVGGVRVRESETLAERREFVADELASLPERYRRLRSADEYPVAVSDDLAMD